MIVLDLDLPAGDGVTILKRLKGMPHLATVPVLVVTGRDAATWQEVVLESDAAGFLQKPIIKEPFLTAVRKCLGLDTDSESAVSATCSNCGHPVEAPRVDHEAIEKIALEVARAVLREVCPT